MLHLTPSSPTSKDDPVITLRQFNSTCREYATLLRQTLTTLPDKASGLSASLQRLNTFLPPDTRLATLINRLLPRHNTTKELFYGLRRENDAIATLIANTSAAYPQHRKTFFDNFYHLVQLHDELAVFVKGKTLQPAARSWVESYFRIFQEWVGEGSDKEIATLLKKIITPILNLNAGATGNPFIHRSSVAALQCQYSAEQAAALIRELHTRLEQHAAIYKKVIAISTLATRDKLSTRHPLAIGCLHAIRRLLKANRPSSTTTRSRTPNHRPVTIGLNSAALIFLLLAGYFIFKLNCHPPTAANITTPKTSTNTPDLTTNSPGPISNTPKLPRPENFPWLDSLSGVYGIDISKYQGDILHDIKNFDTLHFVICKATEGLTLTDNTFLSNWEWLKKARLIRGAYHFYIYGDDPVAQARHFLKTTGAYSSAEIPLILDIEEAGIKHKGNTGVNIDSLQSHLLRFIRYIGKQTGRDPIIYTDLSFADTYLHNKAFAGYPLWLAEYTNKTNPSLPWAWLGQHLTFWQRSSTYTLASRHTDYDCFIGTGHDLAAFLTHAASSAQ